ncbi:RAMP superfamily CRISPR-associated protein [Nonomuraea angiospora]|uniref:RAMP superfamily CRISPR-associated protein n=1 Tax=Nonomuraea angiospora TaxID=46172 RepID=UPI0029BF881C|nr:RAMP superfamily CRISPR-associated protein [Nonomuraea angiospora]MDX3099972.1 RAMP superfamily CRISPR-associated protein [Nonomuraea angiospora]
MSAPLGRPVTSRIRVRGWLRTESPLHVGGLQHDPSEPLPIAVDGKGRLYVPGTTLAGVLRAWCLGTGEIPSAMDELWGYESDDGEGGQASRVIVADALVTSTTATDEHGVPAKPLEFDVLEFRPSVGIDRVTGAAAPEFLYGRQVVPIGCYLRLELDIESREDADRDEARLGALLAALSGRQVRVGASTSKGFGSVRLLDDPLDVVVDRLDSPEGLLAVLRNDPSRRRTVASLREASSDLPPRRKTLDVRIDWAPNAPVMVRSGAGGLFVDTLPLATRIDGRHLTLVLPGSSIKGVLRSQAELIERTARSLPARSAQTGEPAARHSAAFRAQLDQLPAVRALFGGARDDVGTRGVGALRAEECLASVTIPQELWTSVTGFGDEVRPPDGDQPPHMPEPIRDRLADLGLERADHVALDRWTGGAADGRLFSVLEPHGVRWEPIRLSVDLTRLDTVHDVGIALLLLVLRDLADGRITIGAATNRGFGDVDILDITLSGGPWPEPVSLANALAGPAISSLSDAWTAYLAQEVS